MLPSRYKPLTANALAGGFGSVLKCQDTYLDRVVLFKSMHDPANNGQLLNEITALTQARSRHVVDIYDVVVDANGNLLGIIIEYLDGRHFNNFHNEIDIAIDKYIYILYQLAIALKDLHTAGITHRDLKIDNFKESSSGLIKLFDFGISSTQPDYFTAVNRGTLIYTAPEFFVANKKIEPTLDIYSFGVCAWVLSVGLSQIPAVLRELPPQSSSACPSIGDSLPEYNSHIVNLIDACLSKNPAERPTANQLVDELGRILVYGEHIGVFAIPGKPLYILSNDTTNNATLSFDGIGEVEVAYDGFDFIVRQVAGAVFINNQQVTVDMKLPSACVLAFGFPNQGSQRQWIPFFSSHPEVIL